jgi:hypothetical protein
VVGSVAQLGNWDPSNAVRVPIDNWEKITVITDQHLRGIDPAGSNQLPRVGRDGVLAAEHNVRVQVHSQRV